MVVLLKEVLRAQDAVALGVSSGGEKRGIETLWQEKERDTCPGCLTNTAPFVLGRRCGSCPSCRAGSLVSYLRILPHLSPGWTRKFKTESCRWLPHAMQDRNQGSLDQMR